MRDPGVVDVRVDAFVGADDLANRRGNVGSAADVTVDVPRAPRCGRVDRAGDARAAGIVDVEQRHRRALLCELLGDVLAEAGSAAGDDRDFALQPALARRHVYFCVIVCSVLNSYIAAKPLPRPCPLRLNPPNGNSIPPPAP